MCFNLFIAILLLSFVFSNPIQAQQQSRQQLERQKQTILNAIKEIEGILSQTSRQRQISLQELTGLNSRISEQEKLLTAIRAEVRVIDREIRESVTKITNLETELSLLKEEYAAMVYATSKVTNSQNELLYLFSSKSFYQMFMRYKYLQQYADTRKKQAKQIEKVRSRLELELQAAKEKREEQGRLLASQLSESNNLKGLKEKQQTALNALSRREAQLKKDIADRQKSVESLNKLIADAVKAEMARANAAVERSSEAAAVNLRAETARLSGVFAENKSRLPWPVNQGFVSQKFGNQPHPTLKGITIPNDGIDIRTQPNSIVTAVFDGEVSSIANVPGMNTVVLIKHGDYFTVYARLSKVFVKNGQTVKAGESIGEIYTNSDGIAELQFQIWKSTEAVNPQDWLFRR